MKFFFGLTMIFICCSGQLSAQSANLTALNLDSLVQGEYKYAGQKTDATNNLFRAGTINHIQISRLPVRGLKNYMLMQPGVQEQDGSLSILPEAITCANSKIIL
jgi:hypothetical protein